MPLLAEVVVGGAAAAGRGINRRSGALIIAAYLVFTVTVIAKAIPPAA
jgi:hypothetical protein